MMMDYTNAYLILTSRGFALRLGEAGKLLVAPASGLTVKDKELIVQHKAGLVRLVGQVEALNQHNELAAEEWRKKCYQKGWDK